MMPRNIFITLVSVLMSSCAQLHRVQLGEIQGFQSGTATPFEIKVSETGIEISEAAELSKVFMDRRGREQTDQIMSLIALFQLGPRTGNPVYTRNYAQDLIKMIYQKCPSGVVTGLMSIRETRKYPVISGEIVKITGYCLSRQRS